MRIRIGTRGSRLARAQSGRIADELRARGHEAELVVIETAGDVNRDVPFDRIGAPGVFVRELERALQERRVELAVHSYKDLPSAGPDDLVVAAVPEREDPRDVLFVRAGAAAPTEAHRGVGVRESATVGTASARRAALLADLRPDLTTELLRGNVPTRLQRLQDGAYDAIVLAAAGVRRLRAEGGEPLSTDGLVEQPLDPALFVPAPSQGALALQVRADDAELREVLAALDDAETRRCVRVERRVLELVEGGCSVPLGAWCVATASGALQCHAALGTDGGLVRAQLADDDPERLAQDVWRALRGGARS